MLNEQLRQARRTSIDAGKPGTLIARVHRELTDAESERITSTYHACCGDLATKNRAPLPKTVTSSDADMAGNCRSTTTEIAPHSHVPTPSRHVRAEEAEADGAPFEKKMPCLVAELDAESGKLGNLAGRTPFSPHPTEASPRSGSIRFIEPSLCFFTKERKRRPGSLHGLS